MKPYLYPLYFLAIVALSSNVWDLRDACNAGNIDRLNTILSNDANLPFLTSRDFGITSLGQSQSAKRNLTLDASQCSITLFIIADNSMINTSRQRDCYERLIEHYCSYENPNRNFSETIWNCDVCAHMRSMNLLRAAIDTFKFDPKKLLHVTQLLINSGADPNALDSDGLPAIEVFFRDRDCNHDVMRILGENTNMTMPLTVSKNIAHWYYGQVDNLFQLMTQRGNWEKNEGSAVKCLSLFSDNMTFDKFLSLIEPFDWSDESRQRCVKSVIDQTLEFPEKLRPLCWQSISPANPILRDAVECHKNSWDRRYQIQNLVLPKSLSKDVIRIISGFATLELPAIIILEKPESHDTQVSEKSETDSKQIISEKPQINPSTTGGCYPFLAMWRQCWQPLETRHASHRDSHL